MSIINTGNSPSSSLVVPHFVFASISFLMLAVMVLLNIDALQFHYNHPRVFSMVHLAALCWSSMIIFGALYQLIPVVFEVRLFSEKLAKFNFWFFAVSSLAFVFSFYFSRFGDGVAFGGILVFISLVLFAVNVLISISKSNKKDYSAKFVKASIYWLLGTSFMGLLLGLNYRFHFLDQTNYNLLKLHAHIGIIGWLLLLVMGVASILVPMFLVSHNLDQRKLKYAYHLTNTSMLLLVMDWLVMKSSVFQLMYILVFAAGLLFFLSFIRQSYKNKLRKLDVGMKHTMVAFVLLFLPLILAILIYFNSQWGLADLKNISVLYGMAIFLGFFSNMILGQTYKTLPFIIWLDRYKQFVGKGKTPMPREMYMEKLSAVHFYTYLISLVLLFAGLLTDEKMVLFGGAIFLLITAVLFNVNVLYILLVKKKVEPFEFNLIKEQQKKQAIK